MKKINKNNVLLYLIHRFVLIVKRKILHGHQFILGFIYVLIVLVSIGNMV